MTHMRHKTHYLGKNGHYNVKLGGINSCSSLTVSFIETLWRGLCRYVQLVFT